MWIKMKSFINNKYPFLLSFWPYCHNVSLFYCSSYVSIWFEHNSNCWPRTAICRLLCFFRETLLHHPGSFFYSFSKAIGGEMIGEWAYYLLSPFNLLFIFFPGKSIAAGVLVVTLLKYGFCGLSFAYLLSKENYKKVGWYLHSQLVML